MKLFICPNYDCEYFDCQCDDKCKHSINHLFEPDCKDTLYHCPLCIVVDDFIEADEMEI